MARARTAPFDEASWLRLDPAAGETRRAALGRSLLEAMREGALRPGGRLPSSRRLAAQLGASRGVVSDAYEQLAAQGYVDVRSRSAPVVAAVAVPVDTPRAAPEPAAQPRWDLTAATPDVTLFPMRRWVSALRHAAAYASPRGSA